MELQRSASLTFAEITERGNSLLVFTRTSQQDLINMPPDVREVDRHTLEPILLLLSSPDLEVQRASSAALGNLAVNGQLLFIHSSLSAPNAFLAENKVAIVEIGGLNPLIRQMNSSNVEVQCNAVGCITNLATHESNKARIAKSGALGPLTRLAKSKDMRVQRNATGALLNMTHSGEPIGLPIVDRLR